jgi:hypothetical protein
MRPGVSLMSRTAGWRQDPDLVVKDRVPRSTERIPGTSLIAGPAICTKDLNCPCGVKR